MTAEAMSVAMTLTSLEVEVATKSVPMNLHQLPRNPRLHGKNLMINVNFLIFAKFMQNFLGLDETIEGFGR